MDPRLIPSFNRQLVYTFSLDSGSDKYARRYIHNETQAPKPMARHSLAIASQPAAQPLIPIEVPGCVGSSLLIPLLVFGKIRGVRICFGLRFFFSSFLIIVLIIIIVVIFFLALILFIADFRGLAIFVASTFFLFLVLLNMSLDACVGTRRSRELRCIPLLIPFQVSVRVYAAGPKGSLNISALCS